MGFKQTPRTDRQGLVPPDRPGPRAVRQRADGQVGASSSQDAGFDGWEEASWELDLRRCDTDAGAAAYAKERVDLAKKHGLEIFTVAAHLQGQVLGDEPTRQDAAVHRPARRGRRTRRGAGKGNKPPRTDPYFVPDEVGKLVHAARPTQATCSPCVRLRRAPGQAAGPQGGAARLRRLAGPLLEPLVPVPAAADEHRTATPSPTCARSAWNCWSSASARSATLCKKYGVTFDLECHPSERAMGDLESAQRLPQGAWTRPGYAGVVGFNLDGSHMEWQNVSVVAVHPRVRRRASTAPTSRACGWPASTAAAGRLGGHRPMGHWTNGWNFVTAGTARDANSLEEIFIELNRVGFDGAVSIEWEDNDAEQHAGAQDGAGELPQGRPARPAACGTTRCSKGEKSRNVEKRKRPWTTRKRADKTEITTIIARRRLSMSCQ